MEIKKNITNVNRTKMEDRKIEYIVIHYVGAVSSAYNNTVYFKDVNRKASAHYFVDDNEIWQCVEDGDAAWHCGGGIQGLGGHTFYKKCLNANSIGIEMCCYKNNGTLDISDKTVANTVELVKKIAKKYKISSDKVIRHYDVTGKLCPAPFVKDNTRWQSFKDQIEDVQYVVNDRVASWQIVMNRVYRCNLTIDRSFGPICQAQANKHQLYKRAIVGLRIRNDYVRWLQNRLKELGYNITVDGSYWTETDKAVKLFQKNKGLKVDGYVGANTVKELLK